MQLVVLRTRPHIDCWLWKAHWNTQRHKDCRLLKSQSAASMAAVWQRAPLWLLCFVTMFLHSTYFSIYPGILHFRSQRHDCRRSVFMLLRLSARTLYFLIICLWVCCFLEGNRIGNGIRHGLPLNPSNWHPFHWDMDRLQKEVEGS